MAAELSLYPVTAAGKCKCNRGLPGSFCDACYSDLDRWTGRLKQSIAMAKKEPNPMQIHGSPVGQWLYSLWDDLEVAGFMHENGISQHRSSERGGQKAQPGSEPSTTNTESRQTPQSEKKKKPFWKRQDPKHRGRRARFAEKLRRLGLGGKSTSTKSTEPWVPFCENDLDRL
jgi:hypothetical protein